MKERFVVRHGGIGPIPGSEKARRKRCTCPGDIGDKDRWGVPGFTVDNLCRIHGHVARRLANEMARQEMRRLLRYDA